MSAAAPRRARRGPQQLVQVGTGMDEVQEHLSRGTDLLDLEREALQPGDLEVEEIAVEGGRGLDVTTADGRVCNSGLSQ